MNLKKLQLQKKRYDISMKAVKNFQRIKLKKKMKNETPKKILEKLCHNLDKLINIYDGLDLQVKTIENLHSFQCGEDAIIEQNMAISVSEIMKPFIKNNSYMEVVEYYSTSMNRPEVRGFVVSFNGVGGSTLCNGKYEGLWVNLLRNNIPVNDIIVLSVRHELIRILLQRG